MPPNPRRVSANVVPLSLSARAVPRLVTPFWVVVGVAQRRCRGRRRGRRVRLQRHRVVGRVGVGVVEPSRRRERRARRLRARWSRSRVRRQPCTPLREHSRGCSASSGSLATHPGPRRPRSRRPVRRQAASRRHRRPWRHRNSCRPRPGAATQRPPDRSRNRHHANPSDRDLRHRRRLRLLHRRHRRRLRPRRRSCRRRELDLAATPDPKAEVAVIETRIV